jgi:Flp pilus assembly protein TadG
MGLFGRMAISANRRNLQVAQSIVELAVATPVLIALLLGAFDVGVMVSDKVIAGAACRQGARLAAEIGGQRTNPGLTQAQADADIVRNVLAVAQAMNYSTITAVYIYSPQQPDGDLHPGDPVDQFNGAGNPNGPQTFLFQNRNQVPPNETMIAVRIEWQYNPPTGFSSFTVQLSEHTMFLASPVLP